MRNPGSLFSRFLTGLIAGALIAFVLSGIAVKAFRRRNVPAGPAFLLKQGFDFRALRSGDQPWKGPAIGERIDLKMLKAADGSAIATVSGKQPVMLVSINPACSMCTVARDQMRLVREALVVAGIQYYPVCFSPIDSQRNFFDYSKALGLKEPAFEWQGTTSPGSAVLDMTVPSHLFVDYDGTVIQVWPGSNADQEVRQRMATQIVNDTMVIKETVQAILPDRNNSSLPKNIPR